MRTSAPFLAAFAKVKSLALMRRALRAGLRIDRSRGRVPLRFQTQLAPDALERRLLRFFREARVIEEEHGVNIPFWSLDFLTGLGISRSSSEPPATASDRDRCADYWGTGLITAGNGAEISVGDVTTGASTGVNRVVKIADTLVFAFNVTEQLLASPLHAPPQLARPQAVAGVAVSVTVVPAPKLALQVEPQSMPDGELVTLPPGLPMTDTERAYGPVKLGTFAKNTSC
jgi:hypothetical protein